MSKAVCWLDGTVQPLQEARIPVVDHGLLYGDGVFEGIRFFHGTPFLFEAHAHRLQDSARAIALSFPWNVGQLKEIIKETIAASGFRDGYLRVIITRGDGLLGIDPCTCRQPRLIVIADQLRIMEPGLLENGASLIIASTRRLSSDGLDPRIKSLNYLNHILARIEANESGVDEAILLNNQGRVSEGTADNLFIVKNRVLLTPPVIDGALAGITRQLVLSLAENNEVTAREQSLAPYDLYTADECFLTGTGAEMIPVSSIDGRSVTACPGPVFSRLRKAYRAYIEDTCMLDKEETGPKFR